MAAETSHDSSHAVQLKKCCITGALANALTTCTTAKENDLSRELKNYKEDEETGQEDQSEIYNINITVCSPALKQSEELIILQEGLNEVANNQETENRQHTSKTMRTQLEDDTATKEGDSNTEETAKEEHDEKDGATLEDIERQEEEVGDFLQKEEAIVAEEAEKSNSELNQKGEEGFVNFSEDGTFDIPKGEDVGFASDEEINFSEVDTKEQRVLFDHDLSKTEAVELCRSPSLHEPLEEDDDKAAATDEEAEVIVAQKEEESNSEFNQRRNEDSKNCIKEGTIAIDIAADDETHIFEVDMKERRPPLEEPEEIFKNLKGNGNDTTATSDQEKADHAVRFPIVQNESDTATFCPKGAIAQNIHQGELLLYRLHLVQQNQELQQVSDGPSASNTAAMVMTNETVNTVTLREGTEGESDDTLPCRVETTQGNERQKEQNQVEVEDTSSAGTGEDSQAEMGKENTLRLLEETPIQREIRQGLEREKSLRRSRGLGDLENKSQEFVEIPVKRSLEVPDQSSGSDFGFNVEKRLAKRKMLQDINQEAMKEQAVKKLGKVPGLYYESYAQELKERKMLFEAFQQCKKTDTQGSSRGRKLLSSSFTAKNAETPFVHRLERTRSLDLFTNYQFKISTSPSTGSESHQNYSHKKCQIKDLEDDASSASFPEKQSLRKSLRPSISSSSLNENSGTILSVQDNEKENEEGSVLKGKNPFFQLRPSLSLRPDMEKEIREAMEREQELRRLRSRLYGEQWNRPGEQLEENTQSHCPESTSTVSTDHVYRGKLTLIWPPPRSKVEEESGPPMPVGQRSILQNCWETGMVNSSCSEND